MIGKVVRGESGAATLFDDTLSVLQQWKKIQEAEARAWGGAWTDSGLVFMREDGSTPAPCLRER